MQASSTAAPFSFLGAIISGVHISAAINTLKSIAHSFSARGKPQQASQNNQTYWFRIWLAFVNSSMRVLMSNKKCLGFKIKINFAFTRVTHNSHTTDIPVALEFPIELEFRNVDFCRWREENRRTRRKTLGASTRTNNKLNPLMFALLYFKFLTSVELFHHIFRMSYFILTSSAFLQRFCLII